MRINGRHLRYNTLAERRFMLGVLGTPCLRVPRAQNPYAVARRIRRMVDRNEDAVFLKTLATWPALSSTTEGQQ